MAKRMFVAIGLPDPPAGGLAALDPGLPGLRWLPAAGLHLTLSFLGAVPEEQEEPLVEALRAIEGQPFPLVLKGLGSFGRRGRAGIVWAGVEPSTELSRLHRAVTSAVLAAGLEVEKRPFRPHVTLGRCKVPPVPGLQAFLESYAAADFGTFTAGGFTLYRSILRPGGAEHLPVFRRCFGGG